MNIQLSANWLRDYLKTDAATKTIASYLTACGPSVDRMEKVGEDYIMDIEVTTNRPDAFCTFGIAREAHAILKSSGQKSTLLAPKGLATNLDPDRAQKEKLNAIVTNPKLCPRFTAIILEVKIQQSPAFIKNRLYASGIRPINNIVDITNYVMLEMGQPMHAFDFDKIAGGKMLLRASRVGEKLKTLDGTIRNLPTGTIVIEDEKHIIDLCGIMGGENSQITSRTKRIVLFAQSYDPITIRKTSQALAFRTDASSRFEKGLDLENILPALTRAVYLAKKNASAKIISELVDIYPKKQTSPQINLKFDKLDKYLGISLGHEKVASILNYLGFKTTSNATQIAATAPSWRAKDTETDVDLIEEVARIYGYHNLPSSLPKGEVPSRQNSILKDTIKLKNTLRSLGLSEVMTYSIISAKLAKTTGIPQDQLVELTNPLTEEWQFMRPTAIPSLLEVLAKNQNIANNAKIFEIAKTYDKTKNDLPIQDLKLAVVLQNSNFQELKGLIENFFLLTKRSPTFEKFKEQSALFETTQSAIARVDNIEIGEFGIASTSSTRTFGLTGQTAIAEINLTKIYEAQPLKANYHLLPKFPPVIEDISAIYSVNTPLANIIAEIKKTSEMVKRVDVLDIFEDTKLGEGKKSITLTLTYQKSTSTPKQEEVNIERQKISKHLESTLLAKIRK